MPNYSSTLGPPNPDQIELSLFGPGFGESVVVHLGDGDWMVVDSCRQDSTSPPAAVQYLNDIGVDLRRVVAIVVSHWHDDHIRGVAELVHSCPEARVYFSAALGEKDAKVLIEINGGEPPRVGGGTREVWEALEILKQRGIPMRTVGPRSILYRREAAHPVSEAQVTTLSPSDRAIEKSLQSMISLIPLGGEQRTFLPWQDPNYNAIVLWVQIGEIRLLLGADLEEVSDEIGWTAILQEPFRDTVRAEVFKIPHHGSMTAFHAPVWEQMLTERPHTAITPFRRGKTQLPNADGIDTICQRTERAWITHLPNANRPTVPRDSAVVKTLREGKIRITQRAFPFGHVRLRRNLTAPSQEWEVGLFGAAAPLCSSGG